MRFNGKKSLLAASVIAALALLAGCDGDDGAAGADGAPGADAPTSLNISLVGRAVLNATDPEGAAEIVGFQASKNWIYAINNSIDTPTVEILDATSVDASVLTADAEGVISNTNLEIAITLDLSANTAGAPNSLAISDSDELLAVAMEADAVDGIGNIAFYDISGAAPVFIKNVPAGVLPDNVVFSPDGTKVVVANEGEPSGDYGTDPEGSISVIDVVSSVPADTATQITFTAFNTQQAELEAQGAVFPNPSGRTINGNAITTTVAMDLEPEYVAVTEDSSMAFVSLQENNAMAVVDLSDNSVEVFGLGFKDWSELTLDASDRDGGINFQSYPNLFGMYQPDTIASYSFNGANFVVTANEGDAREYFFDAADATECTALGGLDFDADDGCLSFIDEIRSEDLTLDAAFAAAGVNNDDNDLGRLQVTTFLGSTTTDGTGTYDELYAFGARSFSIFDSNGLLVFDSGDDVGRITASIHGEAFNNNDDENEGDTRSDAKGAEPEALALGKIGTQTYAFVGLERMGGVMVYNITNPFNVSFVDYFINRGLVDGADITGDLAPEGMKFVPAEASPTEQALLIIGNEVSGSVAVWQIEEQ